MLKESFPGGTITEKIKSFPNGEMANLYFMFRVSCEFPDKAFSVPQIITSLTGIIDADNLRLTWRWPTTTPRHHHLSRSNTE